MCGHSPEASRAVTPALSSQAPGPFGEFPGPLAASSRLPEEK
jgi:hypothetical protein